MKARAIVIAASLLASSARADDECVPALTLLSPGGACFVLADSVELRASPKPDAQVVATLAYGTPLKVLSCAEPERSVAPDYLAQYFAGVGAMPVEDSDCEVTTVRPAARGHLRTRLLADDAKTADLDGDGKPEIVAWRTACPTPCREQGRTVQGPCSTTVRIGKRTHVVGGRLVGFTALRATGLFFLRTDQTDGADEYDGSTTARLFLVEMGGLTQVAQVPAAAWKGGGTTSTRISIAARRRGVVLETCLATKCYDCGPEDVVEHEPCRELAWNAAAKRFEDSGVRRDGGR